MDSRIKMVIMNALRDFIHMITKGFSYYHFYK